MKAMKSIIAIVPAACLWKFLFSGYIEKLMGIFVKWTLMVHFTVRPFVKAEIKSETQPQLLILYDIYLENKYQLKKNVWDTGGFPGGSEDKASACNAGELGSIPELGRSPKEGNGNPLQYSLSGESHGQRSLSGYSPRGRKESDTTERLHFTLSFDPASRDLSYKKNLVKILT